MLAYCFGKSSDSTESLNADIEGDPVYLNTKLGRLQEGLAFFVIGNILRNGDRFLIDFYLDNANKDIAIRIAGRISTNSLGRNSRYKKVWGPEETQSAIPFRLSGCNNNIEIQVLFTVECIFIALNGMHIAKFLHRLPFHEIGGMEVRGDLSNVHVERNIVTDYPTRPEHTPHIARMASCYGTSNVEAEPSAQSLACQKPGAEAETFLPLPYYATFDRGFFDLGYAIVVKGRVRANPHMFKVALQVGQNVWPQPTVALLLGFEFTKQRDGETGEPVISRNSFANGKWTGEVKSELATGLRAGAEFHLMVVRGKRHFEIYMNDKPVTDYPFKVNPKYVDTCFISGDVKLLDVDIDTE